MNASPAAQAHETGLGRDSKVIGLIGTAHFASHFYQLSMPALFPLINRAEGISYTELGTLWTVFFLTSGLCQTPAGFLVDRIGARGVLVGGLTLMAGAIALFGLTHHYPVMVVLAFLAGLGNSIFHPADISILTGSVHERRMGRAFSIHYFGGFIGYAAAPLCMVAVAQLIGWRNTVTLAGTIGLIVALLVWLNRADMRDDRDAGRAAGRAASQLGWRGEMGVLLRAPTVFSFLFFALMAMGSVGVMTFGATTLVALLGISETLASSAISANLTGAVGGILVGGWLADRTQRHDFHTAIMVTICVALLLVIPATRPSGLTTLFPVLVAAGVFYGVSCPLRDMVIRSIAPKGAAGKVFGFTYSGMDFGSAIMGVLFGMLLDHKLPTVVFLCVAAFMMMSVLSILVAKVMARRG